MNVADGVSGGVRYRNCLNTSFVSGGSAVITRTGAGMAIGCFGQVLSGWRARRLTSAA